MAAVFQMFWDDPPAEETAQAAESLTLQQLRTSVEFLLHIKDKEIQAQLREDLADQGVIVDLKSKSWIWLSDEVFTGAAPGHSLAFNGGANPFSVDPQQLEVPMNDVVPLDQATAVATAIAKATGALNSRAVSSPPLAAPPLVSPLQCAQLLELLTGEEDTGLIHSSALPNYKETVEYPIDFSDVQLKLDEQEYDAISEFVNDVRMVFRNALLCAEPGSSAGVAARRLMHKFESQLRHLLLQASLA
jgi:hypothetical protein